MSDVYVDDMEGRSILDEAMVESIRILSQGHFHGWPLAHIITLMVELAIQYKDAGEIDGYLTIAEILYITVTGGDTEH